MKKRIWQRALSAFLAMVMVVLLIPARALRVNAVEEATTSNVDYTPFLIESLNNQAVYNEQTADMCYDFYLSARSYIDNYGGASLYPANDNDFSFSYSGTTYTPESVYFSKPDEYPSCGLLTGVLNFQVGDTTKHIVLIAFRGSDKVEDWVTDLAFVTGDDGYHEGFEEVAQLHYQELQSKVTYNLGNGNNMSFGNYLAAMQTDSNYSMIVTGHSLGGGVTGAFVSKYLDNRNHLTSQNVVAYTFASPLTVSDSQASKEAAVVKNIFNIVNKDDIVTKIGADIADGQRTGYDFKYKLNKYSTVSQNWKGFYKNLLNFKKYINQYKKTFKDIGNNHHMGTAYLPTKNYINEHINEYTNQYVLYNNYDSATNTYQRITYNNGQLLVSGTGVLNGNWSDNTLISWAKVKDSCSSLYFSTDCAITEIGDKAFSGMGQLKNELVLPSSLTKIGNYAFFHCGFTGDLIIPSTVTEVGINAFNGCSNLNSIDASKAVSMTWGYGAFSNCVGQHELKLPVDDTGTDLDKIFKTYYIEDTTGIYLIDAKDNTSGNYVLPNDKIYIGRLTDAKIDERPYYDFHYLLTIGHTDTSDNIKQLAQKSLTNIATVDEFGCVSVASNCASGTEFTVIVLDNYKGDADYDVYDTGRFIHFTVNEKNVNFAGGLGTEERPYLIQTYGQLNCIRNDLPAHYKLIADIDCSGNTWATIGSQTAIFTGTIDGNGYKISNLTGSTFLAQNKGTIKNLKLEGASITSIDNYCAGILAALNEGTIDSCQIESSYITASRSYNAGDCYLYVGGLAGSNINTGKVFNSSIHNTSLNASGWGGDGHYNVIVAAGGLVGNIGDQSVIKECKSYNNTVYGFARVNGIKGGFVTDDKAEAFIRVGGVVGNTDGGTITATTYYNNYATYDWAFATHEVYTDWVDCHPDVKDGVGRDTISAGCKPDYTLAPIEYNGHRYAIISESKTWEEAKAHCESMGGHLVTITSAEENTFVYGMVGGRADFWLGATDAETEGVWKWITGETFTYSNWHAAQPDNSGDYLQMFSVGGWDDCATASRWYVCEWDNTEYEREANESKAFSISIAEFPCKTHYYIGETLNLYGLEVVNQEGVLLQGYKVSGYNNQYSGRQTITVDYEDGYSAKKLTTSFEITVDNLIPESVSVQSKKDVYGIGEPLTVNDLMATVYYNDGSVEVMDNLLENESEIVKFTAFTKTLDQIDTSVLQLNYYYAYMTEEGKAAASPSVAAYAAVEAECKHETTVLVNAKVATTLEYGYTGDRECTVCGSIVEEGHLLDLSECTSHTYSSWANHSDTQHSRSCECGAVEYENHTWNEGIVTLAPTQTATGIMTYTCTACSAVKNEVIPIPEISENEPTLYIKDIYATPGSTFSVDVAIKNNPGLSAISFTLNYDRTVLTLENVKNGGLLPSMTVGNQVVLSGSDPVYGDQTVVTLTFKINDQAALGDYSIGLTNRGCIGENETSISMATLSGTLTVGNIIWGDATGDGIVDITDVVRLMKYLAEFDYDTNTSPIAISAGADATGDGTVDITDVVRLMKYLAEYDYDTDSSPVVLGKPL